MLVQAERMKQRLDEVVERLAAGDVARATRGLAQVFDGLAGEDVSTAVFAAALAQQFQGGLRERANLYVHDFDVPQIRLFDLLATRVPQVARAALAANTFLARSLEGAAEATLLSLGIGTGRQEAELLQQLARQGLRRLCVVGVEPQADCLVIAERRLAEVAAEVGVELSFRGLHGTAEGLPAEAWAALQDTPAPRVVNAAFALHHIADREDAPREDVLAFVRSLEPVAVALCEPDVDHFEPQLRQRYRNCRRHFGATFTAIDSLGLRVDEADALKVCFFGREIEDILRPEGPRSERHQPRAVWWSRLRRTGFGPGTVPRLPGESGPVRQITEAGTLRFEFEGEPLVAVLCAVPRGASVVRPVGATKLTPIPAHVPIDPDFHLAALVAVAHADGVIHEAERRFVEAEAAALGREVDWTPRPLESVMPGALSVRSRRALVRDMIFLAMVDGHYSSEEREGILAVSGRLGLSAEAVAALELEVHTLRPDLVAGAPIWLQALWGLAQKGA